MLPISARVRPILSASQPKKTPPMAAAISDSDISSPAVASLIRRSRSRSVSTRENSIMSMLSSIHPREVVSSARFCAVVAPVSQSIARISPHPTIRTGREGRAPSLPGARLLYVIIRRFACDDHVVHVALAQPSVRDADEPGILLQLLDAAAAQVAHAGA